MGWANKLPVPLTAVRALLGPALLLAAFLNRGKLHFGAGLAVAFLSDIFDGIIARRLQVATTTLRRMDSIADSAFFLSAMVAAWLLYPDVIREHSTALWVLLVLELARYAFGYANLKREASCHLWSPTAGGILLFVGFFSLSALGQDGVPVALPIYVGIIADLEGLAISVVLPEWRADVPSLVHALRYRETKI